MMPAHAAAGGYAPREVEGVGAASFCLDSRDEHGMDVLFCEATSGLRIPTGCPGELSRFFRLVVMGTF